MSQHLEVSVRTNIEVLSERVIHEALVATVDQTLSGAEKFLRADRAKHTRGSHGGATEDHIKREDAHDLVVEIEGRLGITPVIEKDRSPTHGIYKHSQAPIFVEEGTRSPIFSPRGKTMWNRPEGIFNRRSVRGQAGQHFMAKTYAEAQLVLRADPSVGLALDAMAALAAAEKLEVES